MSQSPENYPPLGRAEKGSGQIEKAVRFILAHQQFQTTPTFIWLFRVLVALTGIEPVFQP
jgi:hypothetical protein